MHLCGLFASIANRIRSSDTRTCFQGMPVLLLFGTPA
jgi:hypothetical protein